MSRPPGANLINSRGFALPYALSRSRYRARIPSRDPLVVGCVPTDFAGFVISFLNFCDP